MMIRRISGRLSVSLSNRASAKVCTSTQLTPINPLVLSSSNVQYAVPPRSVAGAIRINKSTALSQSGSACQRRNPFGLNFRCATGLTGKVIAVGPGKLLDSGKRGEMSVSIGDEVFYGKYAGTEVDMGTDTYVVIRENDLLAIVDK